MWTLVVAACFLNTIRRICYAAFLFACLSSTVAARGPTTTRIPPTADAPIYRVGDKWIFEYNRAESDRKTFVVQTVVAVTGKQTTFSSSRSGGPASEVDFDSQGNLTRVESTTYEPSRELLRFPMMVGKRWMSHHIQRFVSSNLDVIMQVEVVAFEPVRVAAGTFGAYKIVSKGFNVVQIERLYSAPFSEVPSVFRLPEALGYAAASLVC
ncbi:hypothetical protein [Paraburkholderia sp. A1RO-5L]|uniref:hypothetical protein n=1 Tax=unclassified Paraburkholderia TaxID=2615204 RepID=UPI003B7AF852